MAEHPLLIFPEPRHAERARRYGRGSEIRLPSAQQQAERLAPQFQRLQQAMDQQRLALQGNSLGLQPESVLVLETIGPIQNFIKAVKKVNGLEWLGEFEIDDIVPEHGFEREKKPKRQLNLFINGDGDKDYESQKPLNGQLFLVMTDQSALQQLKSLFNNWQQNPNAEFPRNLAPLKQAFVHLHTIRPWDAEDRIRDTGLLENWRERITHGQQVVPFEVELWFRENPDRQQKARDYLGHVIESLGGEIVQQCVIPNIAYHGVLGKIPIEKYSELLSETANFRDFSLIKCEDIMHLRPVGQCAIRLPDDASELDILDTKEQPDTPQGEPVVALFDGLPLTKHRLLDKHLVVDDPDGYEAVYQAGERAHGTAMASLICHGDLDEGGGPLKRPLYVRPILQPKRGLDNYFYEGIPETILPIDLVHRAVRRLYETEGGEPPVAPSVRIINLSVCDPSRPFDRGMSSWARLLDWLSWKYNVLFVVSAGNHFHNIDLQVQRNDLQKLSSEGRQKAVIEAIAADTRHRRILSPAETFNGITVATSHADASKVVYAPNLIDPFVQAGLPSTISAQGPGYRRTIKPDILLPGGRQFLYEEKLETHTNVILKTTTFNRPPGQRVASPGTSGELDRTLHARGTSNSTALASRWAAFLLDVINKLRMQPGGDKLLPEYDVVLLKTLLVHGADWTDAGRFYESILQNPSRRALTDYVSRFLGYGSANVAKVIACTDQRITVLGVGQLKDGEGEEFLFPLPPSLSAVTEKRRLTVTLAWLTPVNCVRQNYRIAHLWFDPKNNLALGRVCADRHAVQRGTIQHEVLEGEKAVDFYDGENIAIKVNCRADAGKITEPIRYSLAVTLEVAEEVNLPIYQEVKDRLRIRVPIPGGKTT